jgi:hypothetical protein
VLETPWREYGTRWQTLFAFGALYVIRNVLQHELRENGIHVNPWHNHRVEALTHPVGAIRTGKRKGCTSTPRSFRNGRLGGQSEQYLPLWFGHGTPAYCHAVEAISQVSTIEAYFRRPMEFQQTHRYRSRNNNEAQDDDYSDAHPHPSHKRLRPKELGMPPRRVQWGPAISVSARLHYKSMPGIVPG